MSLWYKMSTSLQVVKEIKNWWLFFLEYLGWSKGSYLIYQLRNGIQIKIKGNTPERAMITEIWVNKVNTQEIRIEEKDIIIDVGGGVGIFSLFASYYAKNGVIYSLEPEPESFKLLVENVKRNKRRNIIPIKKAVSNQKGEREFYVNREGEHSFYSQGREIKVPCITLKTLFTQYNLSKINLLKLDCEGAEYEILFECPTEVLEKIEKITMECHNFDETKNENMVKRFLEKNGFKVKIKHIGKGHYLYAKREEEDRIFA